MKITKIDGIPLNDNLVLLGAKGADFEEYLQSSEEKEFVRNRLSKDKTQIVVNQYNRQIFIQVIKDPDKKTHHQVLEDLRVAAAKFLGAIKFFDIKRVSVVRIDGAFDAVLAFAEGLALANYQFLKYLKEKDKQKSSLEEIRVAVPLAENKIVYNLVNVINAVYKVRDLINEPLSYLTAEQLSREIEALGGEAGFSVEVLNKKKIESLKMGGLLAVNRGSIDPPTFTILEYKPADAVNKKPVILVGKGVVYDTGGLSLKPAESMDSMKSDMSGAAAVGGILYAVAKSCIPVHIIGLVPATDNRPDGNAYVPGDIIRMYDGTTVEVINTDAEGRLILADALAYAKQYDPELVIDLATLTGAAAAAIGNYGIVAMGNAGRETMSKLIESGNRVHERIAEFPFWEEYGELIKSDIADLKNLGAKQAGSITAGKFLEHFTDYPYIHLDIAGPAFNKKTESYRGKGASGVGVRLIFDFLNNMTTEKKAPAGKT